MLLIAEATCILASTIRRGVTITQTIKTTLKSLDEFPTLTRILGDKLRTRVYKVTGLAQRTSQRRAVGRRRNMNTRRSRRF